MPRLLLRLEGALFAALALWLYVRLFGTWQLFLLLILAPDLSFAAFLAGPRAGSTAYNLAHTYLLPAALFGAGALGGRTTLVLAALVWTAHIGVDRLLGFGLRYPSGARESHLQRV